MFIFVAAELNQSQKERLSSGLPSGSKIFIAQDAPVPEAKAALQEAQIIFGNPPVAWFSTPLPALQFWQLDSAGFDQFQKVHLTAVVANMGDFYAQACAETMVASILAFYRGLPTLVKLQEQQQWKGKLLRPQLDLLINKKVLILGAGSIAQAIKKMLRGFGCQVLLTGTKNPLADLFSYDAVLQELPHTQIVINTLPGHLKHYVSKDFFEQMTPGSLYANVGRGITTDEQAPLNALKTKRLAGAVLDVTEQEPLPASSPFWSLENVLLTQHTGGGQALETEGKIDRFLKNLTTFLAGENVPDQIDLTQGY